MKENYSEKFTAHFALSEFLKSDKAEKHGIPNVPLQCHIQRLAAHNRQFETPQIEQELVDVFFRRPLDKEVGEYMPVSRAMQIIGGSITQHISVSRLGQAFTSQGFEFKRTSHSRGYIVVQRDAGEIKSHLTKLAEDGRVF